MPEPFSHECSQKSSGFCCQNEIHLQLLLKRSSSHESIDIVKEFTGKTPDKNPLCCIGSAHQELQGGETMIYVKEKRPLWTGQHRSYCSHHCLGIDPLKPLKIMGVEVFLGNIRD